MGTQFGGSAVWASRSPPTQQIEFGSTHRRELARLVQRAGTVRRPGLAFPTRAAAERTQIDWLLIALNMLSWHGPETGVRLRGAAVLAVVPGPWGSYQAMIKVLPGRRPARVGLGELTGRRARGSDLWWLGLVAPQADWQRQARQVSVIEMKDGQGNSLTAAG